MEKIVEVLVPAEVGYECDDCKKGFMYPTGLIVRGKGLEHKCDNCSSKKVLKEKYPLMKYIKKSEIKD